MSVYGGVLATVNALEGGYSLSRTRMKTPVAKATAPTTIAVIPTTFRVDSTRSVRTSNPKKNSAPPTRMRPALRMASLRGA